jgi:hypothetical protein
MTALMVCSRFSAWSNTTERVDSKLVGDLGAVQAVLVEQALAQHGGGVVDARQAVHELRVRLARGRHDLLGDPVGQQRRDRGGCRDRAAGRGAAGVERPEVVRLDEQQPDRGHEQQRDELQHGRDDLEDP